jgi:ABC-type nitrate/sulfonate/bicarbonate transport system permease component
MINQAGARFQTDKVFVGVLTIVAAGVILGRDRAAGRAPSRHLAYACLSGTLAAA